SCCFMFEFSVLYAYVHLRHLLSFPTRRSSDLACSSCHFIRSNISIWLFIFWKRSFRICFACWRESTCWRIYFWNRHATWWRMCVWYTIRSRQWTISHVYNFIIFYYWNNNWCLSFTILYRGLSCLLTHFLSNFNSFGFRWCFDVINNNI